MVLKELALRAARMLGEKPVTWLPVSRGYTQAQRWVVGLPSGTKAFVKAATDENTARWLRREYHAYTTIIADFMPRVLGWEDDEQPVLVLEDLSHGFWPPPWTPQSVARVLTTLRRVASTSPPPDLPRISLYRDELLGWSRVAEDPAPFLSLGLCSALWLRRALPALLAAQEEAELDGDDLLHFDVRSDNICLLPARVVLVDWNSACRGNGVFDIVAWLPSLRAEGGPPPEEIVPDAGPLAAVAAGHWASKAGLPAVPGAPRVRAVQLSQLREALPWVVQVLGLPPLDGDEKP